MKKVFLFGLSLLIALTGTAQEQPKKWQGKFEQLDQILPTPNSYRSSSGAPGPDYWQQRADYIINVELNDENQSITGSETITYYNNAPEDLKYLWMQLDQNINADKSMTQETSRSMIRDSVAAMYMASSVRAFDYKGGFNVKDVKDAEGKAIPYLINYTMMRVDLPRVVKQGEKFTFSVDWSYNVNDRMIFDDRGGMEFFPEDGNYIYTDPWWRHRQRATWDRSRGNVI